jgi:hypothetical protein
MVACSSKRFTVNGFEGRIINRGESRPESMEADWDGIDEKEAQQSGSPGIAGVARHRQRLDSAITE